jgi:hypothetical protein
MLLSLLRRTRRGVPHAALAAAMAASPGAAAEAPRTLRLDLVHAGGARAEHFALERVVAEPLPWPGDPARALDDTNLGKYRFEVIDRASRRVLYSRGFASIYGEWETTGEAREIERGFAESLRFPAPTGPVQVVVQKRDPANDFRELWSVVVDPADLEVERSAPASAGPVVTLQESGPPASKVDLLLLGDGYTAPERGKCEADLARMTATLFEVEPFRSRRADFNVRGLCPAAAESGVSRPSLEIHRRSPAGATYDALRAERYILTFANRDWRDLAAQAPYEALVIVTNSRTYGGGGIFGQFATVAADSAWAPYILVHEFAHHFAALADEYYTSDVAYLAPAVRIEPWEPNLTALLDPARLKWRDLVTAGTPVPTPWGKEAYEARAREIQAERRRIRAERRSEEEMDRLFETQRAEEEKRFGAEPWARAVGAFEGAGYEARGLYRPQADCIMFTRDRVPFCAVCRRALERVIDLHAGPPAR